MKNKSSELYKKLFSNFVQNCKNLGYILTPNLIICDFELALINSIEIIFPDVLIKGCYFHFTQAIWKHVQQLGLKRSYVSDITFNSWVKMLMSLPYVPVNDIKKASDYLFNLIKPNIKGIDDLINYFNKTWLVG